MKLLWQSGPADAPDGCVLSRAGHIYVALAGVSNQIVELSSKGHLLARFGQKDTGTNNSSVPYDTPSGLAWYGTHLIIANQAFLDQDTSNMALLSLQTGERGVPSYVPRNAGLKLVHASHSARATRQVQSTPVSAGAAGASGASPTRS
jgi:hypothetical protein